MDFAELEWRDWEEFWAIADLEAYPTIGSRLVDNTLNGVGIQFTMTEWEWLQKVLRRKYRVKKARRG